ncbi:hypothetical protein [Erythrobacter sp.]|uniref:hypothetical protein n=1 Tax=Erythrobacter sp. TaxID=1042 RepID=UPI001425D624|nr:hypothetical protein [Erythrobacter sp.]QIQ85887.1 MAG: hypothetical protein G9473_03690 [Erythrobacter sp.]
MSLHARMWAAWLVVILSIAGFFGWFAASPDTMFERGWAMIAMFVVFLGGPLLLGQMFRCPQCRTPAFGEPETFGLSIGLSLKPPSSRCRVCDHNWDEESTA